FKDFFGNKNSKEILESFINSVLGFEGDDRVEIEEFLDPRKMRVEVGKPSTFVDLSVKTRGGERYIIEMQTYNHDGFDKRLLYYLGKDYTEQIEYQYHHPERQKAKKNKKFIGWGDLPKVHVVAVIDFHRDRTKKNGILNHREVVETYRFKPEVSVSNNHLFDHWKATIVDLKKFKAKPINKMKTDKEKWIYILNDAPSLQKEEREALKKDPIFQRALERLEMLSSDPKTKKAFESSINDQRDHLAILEAAENKGRRERDLEIAIALLKQLLPIKQIAEVTGLSTEEIEHLKK
ncbi:MAG: Rpn family recombination-promoting nuclease/putative transposase, partial [Chlamydiia bacterium]|nr:Rpn family recombination-promoting nuclease/putative transposase [Chlamydiia bacterium]